jgi:hypothetical protein
MHEERRSAETQSAQRKSKDLTQRTQRKGGEKSEKDRGFCHVDFGLSVFIGFDQCSSVVILTSLLPSILQPIPRASHRNYAIATHLARAILPCYKYLRAE